MRATGLLPPSHPRQRGGAGAAGPARCGQSAQGRQRPGSEVLHAPRRRLRVASPAESPQMRLPGPEWGVGRHGRPGSSAPPGPAAGRWAQPSRHHKSFPGPGSPRGGGGPCTPCPCREGASAPEHQVPASERASVAGGERKRGARPRARQTRDLQGQGQAEPCGALFPSATSGVAGQRPGSGSRAPQPSSSVLRSDPASCLQPWASAPPAVMGPGRLRGPPALPGLSFSVPERGDGRAAASILFSCGEHTDPRGPARWVSAAPEQGMSL